MRGWIETVNDYRIFVILMVLSGLLLLGYSYLVQRQFRFGKKESKLAQVLYGMQTRDILALSGGVSRLLLVLNLVAEGTELRASAAAALLLLGILRHADETRPLGIALGILKEIAHTVGICACIFICYTLRVYSAQVSNNLPAYAAIVLLSVFLILYNLYLLAAGLPELGANHLGTGDISDEE